LAAYTWKLFLNNRRTRVITWLLHHLWRHRKCQNFSENRQL